MAIFKEYDIIVDLLNGVNQDRRMTFDQNDYNSSRLNITLTKDSTPINLTGSTVSIAFLKKDETSVFQACTITDAANGKVEVLLSSQTLAVPGLVKSELTINNAGDTTTTSGFYFNVKDSIMNDNTVQSANEFSLIQKAIDAGEILGDVDLQTIVDNTNNVNDLVTLTGDHSDILDDHSAQLAKADRQSQVLQHGLAVVNAEGNSPVDVEIQGRTLIPMQNSNLVGNRYYVLADKKTKVKVEGREGAYVTGVAKFQKSGAVSTTGNFVGKVSGSVTENPHIAKESSGATLKTPSDSWSDMSQAGINTIVSLNGGSKSSPTSTSTAMAQQFFSFNIIEQVERKMGRIPATTTSGKILWLRDNVAKFTFNWHGHGSGPTGNKANVKWWNESSVVYNNTPYTHSNATVTKITFDLISPTNVYDANGFINFIAYAEPSDGVTASVINTDYVECVIELKSTAQLDTRPQVLRVANFEGKVAASTVENPHIGKRTISSGYSTLLAATSGSWIEMDKGGAESDYSKLTSLDVQTLNAYGTSSGGMGQQLFSFDLIAEIERNIGRIPRSTVANKAQWLRNNLASILCNWHGYGSSAGGNKATLSRWHRGSNSWTAYANQSHPYSTVYKLWLNNLTTLDNIIDDNGMVHFLAHAEPSDGVTPSVIRTDYIDLEIELKPEAILHDPSVPLYEVTTEEYSKILVDWNESVVLNRYPKVTGVQHLQNPYVMVEGENLLPPFSEWTLSSESAITSPYEMKVTATAWGRTSYASINLKKGQTYTFSVTRGAESTGRLAFEVKDPNLAFLVNNYSTSDSVIVQTFTPTLDGVHQIHVKNGDATGVFVFTNPMLTLGSTAKPFVPRNPSYLFAETKLGQIGTTKDILFRDSDGWKVRKSVEKDVVLDGSLTWGAIDKASYKLLYAPLSDPLGSQNPLAVKFNGSKLYGDVNVDGQDEIFITSGKNINLTVSDTDSGWTEAMTVTANQIKCYFQGWKYTGDGTTHSWASIVDGSLPATNTEAYCMANKAPNYTPYKLSYVLATPQIVPVNVEGDIAVSGSTQVEVGSGVIVREKVVPATSASFAHINRMDLSGVGRLNNKALRLMSVYKNSVQDNKWRFKYVSSQSYGSQHAEIDIVDFDATSEYTVTYLVLDRHLLTLNGLEYKTIYANSIRSAFDDMVAKQSDLATSVSVNIKAIAELYKRVKSLGG